MPSRGELSRGIERPLAERDELRAENARLPAEVQRLVGRVAELEATLALYVAHGHMIDLRAAAWAVYGLVKAA